MAIAFGSIGAVLEQTTASTTWNVPYPAGISAGDMLIVFISSASNISSTLPTGWTLIHKDTTTTSNRISLIYKIATGSETGNLAVTMASTTGCAKMIRYTGVDATTPLDGVTPTSSASATAALQVTLPSITTQTANAWIIAAVALNSTSQAVNTTSGMTERIDFVQQDGGGTGTRAGSLQDEARTTAGATGNRIVTWSASRTYTGALFALRESQGPAGGIGTLTQKVTGIPANPSTEGLVQVKCANTVTARLICATNSTMTTGVVNGASVTLDAEGYGRLTVTGLTSNTRYYYRVEMTDASSNVSTDADATIGRLTTAPVGAANFAFDFGSCANSTDPPVFPLIVARNDDMFFHLGDMFYNDGSGTTLANIQSKLEGKVQTTNHRALYAQVNMAHTPGDHDVATNDSTNGTDPTAWGNWRTASDKIFPDPDLYYTWVWGRVRFIKLDLFNFKGDPAATDNSSKSALGTTQKQWLKDTITAATEKAIVIVQSDVWIGSAVAGDNGWFGHTTERTELANFFAASGKPIIMIGGDMHAVAADDGTNAPGGITVFQAAPFNQTASQKGGPYTTGPIPASGTATTSHYGRVVVTDTGSTLSLAFTGYNSSDVQQVTLTKTIDTVPATTGTLPVTAGLTATASTVAKTTGTLPLEVGLTGTAYQPSAGLALDASTPAAALGQAVAVTSPSFTPPANALLVAVTIGSAQNPTNPTVAITNTGAGLSAWTLVDRATVTSTSAGASVTGGVASIHWAKVNSSVATTVTATQTSGSLPTWLKVFVITGADLVDPIGASGKGFSTANTLTTTAITTDAANSWLLVAASEWSNPTGSTTSSDLNIGFSTFNDQTGQLTGATGMEATGAAGSSASAVIDAPGTANKEWLYVTAELHAGAVVIPSTTGQLPVNAGLSATASTVAKTTGNLSVSAGLNGAGVTVASSTGSLPVTTGLSGSVSTIAKSTGSLPVNAGLTATQSTIAKSTGQLPVNAGLVGVGVKVEPTTGSLPVTVGLTATVVTVGKTTGTLPANLALQGAASTSAQTTGQLGVTAVLVGAALTSLSTTGQLPATVALQGVANAAGSTSGTVGVTIGLQGVASTVAKTTGAIGAAVGLTATGTSVSSTTGNLPVQVGLSAVPKTVVTTTGQVGVNVVFNGAASTVMATTGQLPVQVGLAGVLQGPKITTGELPATVGLVGAAITVYRTTGSLPFNLALEGDVNAVARVQGSLPLNLGLQGTARTVAAAVGSLGASVGLSGSASTLAATSGALGANAGLSATAKTISATSGALPVGVALQALASTVVKTTGALPLALGLTADVSSVVRTTGQLPMGVGLQALAVTVGITEGALPLVVGLIGSTATTGELPVTVDVVNLAVSAISSTEGILGVLVGLEATGRSGVSTDGTLRVAVGLVGVATSLVLGPRDLKLVFGPGFLDSAIALGPGAVLGPNVGPHAPVSFVIGEGKV